MHVTECACTCSGVLQGPWYPAEECSSLLKSSYQLMRIPLGAGRKGLECVSLSELGRMLITVPLGARAYTHTYMLASLRAQSGDPAKKSQSLTHEQRREGDEDREDVFKNLVLSSWFGTNWFQMKIRAHKLEKALMLLCTPSPF